MQKLLLILIFISGLFSSDLILKSTDIVTNGKSVMLIFSSKTCPYCDVLKKDLVENKELNELAKDMNIFEVKRDEYKEYTLWGQPTNLRSLEQTFAIKVTPNIIIFDKTGRKIWQVPGYADPKIMIPYLKFVKGLDDGTYEITQWRTYLQKAGIIK
ncbi:MAG: thioredoxin fold domain-containing protein [Campylobacterota bacterium]|nr:thioredoxin fold domain-containing protein [Campylobacterota bacterium]